MIATKITQAKKATEKKLSGLKIFSSIRGKLTMFIVFLCAILIVLVWILNVKLLEPMYNANIRKSLEHTATVYSQLISQYGYIEDASAEGGISEDFLQAINSLDSTGALLSGKCLDIANADGLNLLHSHQLAGSCALHPTLFSTFGDKKETNWNSKYTVALRLLTMQQGDMSFTLNEMNKAQMVVAKRVNDNYVILVSTDLERIGEAAGIIHTQMPLVAMIVLIVGVLGAFLFSKWFAKPLSEISLAAKRVAAGDYSVRVEQRAEDEIGQLAHDFNVMAYEVGRTSDLQRDLIANISHDLRTPLTLIKGYAETVRDITGDNKEKRNEHLEVIVDETDRLSGLVNSVMELSKVSSGSQKPNLITFDLAQLCDEVALRYSDICTKNNYTLLTALDVPCNVTADPEQISRVIHNLLSNAIHHIGDDGFVAVRCLPLPSDKGARVEISDHGIGIEEAELPYIFDRYYRTRASSGKVGTGLGLSITKAILENHGFKYGVESKLGEGSTFWFEAR